MGLFGGVGVMWVCLEGWGDVGLFGGVGVV